MYELRYEYRVEAVILDFSLQFLPVRLYIIAASVIG